uniref:Uncharacterized protein n=1 Tax=Aegilops tauschii subsp. strangulata TaxID=200361 RepID=A0A453A1N7_AEGTS
SPTIATVDASCHVSSACCFSRAITIGARGRTDRQWFHEYYIYIPVITWMFSGFVLVRVF